MTLHFASNQLQNPVKPLRLGLLTPHNPFDRGAFSGTPYFAARALSAHAGIELHILGPHRPPRRVDRLKARLLRRRAVQPAPEHFGDLSHIDMVLGIVATPLLDRLQRHHSVPFMHVTDATPAFLRETYGWDIPGEADALEKRVVRHATASLYSSDYMAERAGREYAPAARLLSLPFGINLETLPERAPAKPTGPLQLLFVCSDWQRKGGDIVFAALDALIASGVEARLTVVGRVPGDRRNHPCVSYTGFLDKNDPGAAARLAELYRTAHVMLLPTRADCTPMVVAEAMAHGTPVLASNVGGMASLVTPGTGTLMDLSATGSEWARATHALTRDAVDYAQSSARAFSHARTHLTWDAWAAGVKAVAEASLRPAVAA